MRTTLDLDEKLVSEFMKTTESKTNTEAIPPSHVRSHSPQKT
ncbi:MAG: hypothetical protein NPIRA04_31260 [Nitrospirales bacterium]|nr:MAG: hypothetical protein NPIRA04_31260 [Nitrospirales bacterium]